MGKIRVLVVEDSAVIRRLITDIVAEDPELEVAATAANGRIALLKLDQVNPDVVTLDVEMPDMDGLECLRQLRQTHPRLPVIMFSTVTERCASATLDALALGANDYVTKPSKMTSISAGWEHVRQHLLPKIKVLGARMADSGHRARLVSASGPASDTTAATPTPPMAVSPPARTKTASDVRPEVIAIGVSTGGPNALGVLLPALPGDLAVPMVVVQHMPPMFTRMLAERLSSRCPFPVLEAADGMVLEAGCAYLAPGDHHMTIERQGVGLRVRTNQEPPENYCRPAVDVLFRSVARVFGSAVLGLVLTGMGQDGLRGSGAIKEAGGRILIQDQQSSVVWGMPGAVQEAGLADGIYTLEELAAQIALSVARKAPGAGGHASEQAGRGKVASG